MRPQRGDARGGQGRGETRMQRFAGRLERALEANDCFPARREDARIVTDLAEMEVRAGLLADALKGLVAGPRSVRAERSFSMRLLRLVYEVNGVHDLCRELRPRLLRLVREQCGREEKAFELLTLAGTTLKGFAPPRAAGPPRRTRRGASAGKARAGSSRRRGRRGVPS